MQGLTILAILGCYFVVIDGRDAAKDDTICEQGRCNAGYQNIVGDAATKWWACGVKCPGGKYLTDGYCNCACVDRQECSSRTCRHQRGPCGAGYWDRTDGNEHWWACGKDCQGGKYYTDGVCNCACVDKPDTCPDGVVCGKQAICEPGYMDRTGGHYHWWACGKNCEGGKDYTDGTCGCACVPAGACEMVPSYHNFNLYRFVPQLAFIRYFGVAGEYISIAITLAILMLLTVFCYKRKMTKDKMKYKIVALEDSASEAENVPINK